MNAALDNVIKQEEEAEISLVRFSAHFLPLPLNHSTPPLFLRGHLACLN